MRITKQLFCAVLILILPSIAFADFSDVPSSYQYAMAINDLQTQGIIGGYSDGTFRPDQAINRAELLKIIVKGALQIDPNSLMYDCFPDVHQEWFAPYVCHAYAAHFVEGYPDGTFRPDSILNEAEALKIIMTSLASKAGSDLTGCDQGTMWYSVYLCEANKIGMISSTGFAADNSVTRGLAAEWIYNAICAEQNVQTGATDGQGSPDPQFSQLDSFVQQNTNTYQTLINLSRTAASEYPVAQLQKAPLMKNYSDDISIVATAAHNASLRQLTDTERNAANNAIEDANNMLYEMSLIDAYYMKQ